MRKLLLAAAAAAALMLPLLGSVSAMASAHHGPAASSANETATRRATPDTSTAKCSSAWLRLWGSKGESCYSGNGSLAVDLPGVYREQIVGQHQACLSAADEFMTGPGTFAISPPVQVQLIAVRTPSRQ